MSKVIIIKALIDHARNMGREEEAARTATAMGNRFADQHGLPRAAALPVLPVKTDAERIIELKAQIAILDKLAADLKRTPTLPMALTVLWVNDIGGYSRREYQSLKAMLDHQETMYRQGWWLPGPSVAIGQPLPGCA